MYSLFQSLIISPLITGAEGGHSWKASVPREKEALSHVTLLDGNPPLATSLALPRPTCLSMSTIVSTPHLSPLYLLGRFLSSQSPF